MTSPLPPASSLFVTGTDTGIGKTVISALLCRTLGAGYWKPLQTGAEDGDDDTRSVAEWAGLAPEQLTPPARIYQAPASPARAAELEGERVSVADVLACRPPQRPLVVEGAGGVWVPINEQESMLDLIRALALPTVIVARSGLGTINHTLLTVEALRRRDLPILGVILSGPPALQNAAAIEHHGQVPVLAQVPTLPQVTPQALAALAETWPLAAQA